MAGETIEFSQADLEATAAAFSPSISKAPIVIGHPATDDPAQGWIASLQATARGLFATPSQVEPAFAEAMNAGRYGTVSAKFYRPLDASNPVPGVWYLRHVGVLGAQNPAVKGLDDPAFAALDDDGCVCFSEGVAFSHWDERDERKAKPAISQPNPLPENTVTPEQKAALEAENTQLKDQLAQSSAREAKNVADQAHAGHVAFCEGLAAKAQLLPAQMAVAVAALDHLAAQAAPVEFGEAEAKAPLLDGFKAFLAALPEQVSFGEAATSGRAAGAQDASVAFAAPSGYGVEPLAMALHAKALAHQKAHAAMSYVDAVKAVS